RPSQYCSTALLSRLKSSTSSSSTRSTAASSSSRRKEWSPSTPDLTWRRRSQHCGTTPGTTTFGWQMSPTTSSSALCPPPPSIVCRSEKTNDVPLRDTDDSPGNVSQTLG